MTRLYSFFYRKFQQFMHKRGLQVAGPRSTVYLSGIKDVTV